MALDTVDKALQARSNVAACASVSKGWVSLVKDRGPGHPQA